MHGLPYSSAGCNTDGCSIALTKIGQLLKVWSTVLLDSEPEAVKINSRGAAPISFAISVRARLSSFLARDPVEWRLDAFPRLPETDKSMRLIMASRASGKSGVVADASK